MVNIRLIQGDCLDEMQKLIDEDVKVDMVLTDPPYGTTACKWDTVIPFEPMWECIDKLSNPTTPILLFGSEPFSSYMRLSNINNYRYDWIWHKNSSGDFALAKKRPMRYHELISVFYKKLPIYNPIFQEYSDKMKVRFKNNGKVNRDKQLEHSTNRIHGGLSLKSSGVNIKRGKYPECIQKFNSVRTSQGNRVHPTQKPVELLEYLIKTYTDEGDLVLDFTMGSGSTGVACKNLNRDFIGIELDNEYFKIAEERCKNYPSKLL